MFRLRHVLAVAALAACQGSSEAPDSRPGAGLEATEAGLPAETAAIADLVGREFDLSALQERAVVRFRDAGGRIEADRPTHRARVARPGAIELTARTFNERVAELGAPMTLSTTRIYREVTEAGAPAIDIDVTPGPSVIDADGLVSWTRSDVVEKIENRAASIEQTWTFFEAPQGDGDVFVEVAVDGAASAQVTRTGVHLAAARGPGFNYGHATWIDAEGNEVNLPVAWHEGRLRLRVPADVIANSTFPAVLDPTVTAEVAVDAPVVGPTGAATRTVSVAWSGSEYLAVWRDERNGTEADIYATRISAAGVVLDNQGIVVSTAAGLQDNPVVTWVGDRYLVAWEDWHGTTTDANIVAATVSAAGAVSALGNVAASAASETGPAIAARGNEALLTWSSGGDIAAARYASGSFGATSMVSATADAEAEPTVAANPAGDYLVAWTRGTAGSDVRGQLVTAAGANSGASFDVNAGAGGQSQPSAGYDGGQFVVAWTNNSGGVEVFASRVSTAGAVVDTTPIAVTAAADNQNQPAVGCNTGCVITWRDRRNLATTSFDIYARAIDSAGALGTELALITAVRDQQAPAIIGNGTGYLAAWHDDRFDGPAIAYAARLDATGASLDGTGFALPSGNNREVAPAAATSGSQWFATWSDSRALGNDIVGVRIALNGSVTDGTARVVSNAAAQQSSPAVTTLGANFYAAWADSRGDASDIYGSRIDATATALDPAGLALNTAANEQLIPDVASDGTGGLVVWQDRRGGNFDIYAARIDGTGAVVTADITVCAMAGDQTSPAVAWDASSGTYVVVWSDSRAGAANADIYGLRINADGTLADAACGLIISNATNGQFAPDVTFQAGQGLVAWDDRRTDGGNIYASRVTATGSLTVLDPTGIVLSAATDKQTDPTVVPLTGSYLVAWTDSRTLATTSTDVYGQVVSTTGQPDPGDGFVIAASAQAESNPAAAPAIGMNPNALVLYTRYEPSLSNTRVYYRRVKTGTGSGQTCTTNAGCSSGFCVDGKCCDNACGGNNTTDCQACSAARGAAVDGTCGPVNAGRICRNYADTFCDRRELCDGTNIECPEDLGRREGVACTTPDNTGGVCPANDVSGAPHICE